ncbi:MAG: anhydro-N-acetylmuramic acid kinase [Rickettsiales bacterium]|nr:MAG: anhydro-N-acetylmuramic acid kinase [Rickettsiales bacterium]
MSDYYIGLMSGTSFDGVDASLVRTDGRDNFFCIANLYIPYPKKLSEALHELSRQITPFLRIEKELTEFHIKAVLEILKIGEFKAEAIKAIGFHGQTLLHDPQNQTIWQIGNPHLLSKQTGIDVVYDFRRADMALGGQGAPLVPIFHQMITKDYEIPVVVINIGGVANLTYIDKNQQQLIAFDTGPGNGLIDDACRKYYNQNYDDEGKIAAIGKVDNQIVNDFLQQEYFKLNYPKSLDRNIFKSVLDVLKNHSPEDIIATLTDITASSIVKAVELLPNHPQKIFICGGGSKNKQMIKLLKGKLAYRKIQCSIENISIIKGFDANYVESQAFAYLAARFFQNIASAFPSTTNASRENICGCLIKK